jgi:hypothetical protein
VNHRLAVLRAVGSLRGGIRPLGLCGGESVVSFLSVHSLQSGSDREGINTYSCPPLLLHAARICCLSLRLVMLPSLHFSLLLGRGVIRVQQRSLDCEDYLASPHWKLEKYGLGIFVSRANSQFRDLILAGWHFK